MDAQLVTGHLLPAGSVFAFLAQHRQALFLAEMFTDLFPSGRGRPSVTADVIASVLVLQALRGLSDRQAAEAVMFDLRWKAACGVAVDGVAFHPTVLTYWRRRLAASTDPNRIFNSVKDVIAKTGVLAGKTRRALDSTVLDDAVATQDTVTQLVAAIRLVARTVLGADVIVAAGTNAYDYSKPGKPDIAWDDAQARAVLINCLVTDALVVLQALTGSDAEPIDQDCLAGPAVALLALIAGQDVEPIPGPGDDNGGGRWQIARKVAEDRVVCTVDPQSRHAYKTRQRRQDGFNAHLICERRHRDHHWCEADFDHDARTVTCPAGHTVGFTAVKRTAKFGKLCTDCPLAALCTNASDGRTVTLAIHDKVQRAHRKRWNTDLPLRVDYRRRRPMVERSLAWMTRGARRLRCIGTTKNDAWWQLRAAAINLRKLTQLGLNTSSTGWALT